MSNLVDLLKESKGDDVKESVEVDIEEFKAALSQVDTDMKNLPATAQECEKNPEGPLRFRGEGRHRFHPFRYKLDFV
ncbi:hypothetical protein RND71_033422 [Anisodus tanguticus]|uniref:Uncharacterized protein n=1 Tax=Anisodus tanguticus TaxID=243964 RepID=A0AAE1R8R2_9SOLA|nr:hypothetical protein RND71_033422 [Anisodus tanguticus]